MHFFFLSNHHTKHLASSELRGVSVSLHCQQPQLKVNFHSIFFCFNNMFFFLFYINYEWKLFLWHFYKTHIIQDIRYKIKTEIIITRKPCYFVEMIYYLLCHAILNHFLCHVEFVSSVMLNLFYLSWWTCFSISHH